MKRLMTGVLVVIGMFALSSGYLFSEDSSELEVGKKAPDFTLPNLEGESVTLSEHTKPDNPEKGNMVILQWINPDCPFCNRVHEDGLVQEMMENVREMRSDVVHIQINSTHYMNSEETAEYIDDSNVDPIGLVDRDGSVGKKYGAQTTPHMFIIDRKGILRYNGAIDNDEHGKKSEDERTNYVIRAFRQLINGEEVAPAKTSPYGCSVKYEDE